MKCVTPGCKNIASDKLSLPRYCCEPCAVTGGQDHTKECDSANMNSRPKPKTLQPATTKQTLVPGWTWCYNNCGHQAPPKMKFCCPTCETSSGREHTPICDGAHSAAEQNANTAAAQPNILREAEQIAGASGERNDSYDHPRPNFTKIAGVWSEYFGPRLNDHVTAEDVAHLMILMKVVRNAHKIKRDNIVDIAGYAYCLERLSEKP